MNRAARAQSARGRDRGCDRRRARLLGLLAAALGAAGSTANGAGCGASGGAGGTADGSAAGSAVVAAQSVPVRARTAGDTLLALVPQGADAIVEIDLARLRANPVVGPAVTDLITEATGVPAGIAGAADAAENLDGQLLRAADTVLLSAYRLGRDDATTLTLVRGERVADIGKGIAVAPGVVALGPPALVALVAAVHRGEAAAVVADQALLALRARSMPAKAEGATLRMAALLDFDARVGMAGWLDLDHVPTALSVWGDVIDDLAIVAELDSSDSAQAAQLGAALTRWRDRSTLSPWARALALQLVIARIDIATRGAVSRAVLLIGPKRLTRLVERLTERNREP